MPLEIKATVPSLLRKNS